MSIGVDIGINTLATCSDGSKFANVKAYKQAKKRLVRHQRAVSKKVIGSKNRLKAVKKLAKLHKKADASPRRKTAQGNAHQAVADIRADALHKLTSWLAKNHSTIVIEDLNVSGMLKKRCDPAPPTARLRNAHSCEGMLTKRGNAHQETIN
ncbi:MAG: transposase [Okeania sp. SIO2F4]|nr:transposase [Okeania sp. SIO2F4]